MKALQPRDDSISSSEDEDEYSQVTTSTATESAGLQMLQAAATGDCCEVYGTSWHHASVWRWCLVDAHSLVKGVQGESQSY